MFKIILLFILNSFFLIASNLPTSIESKVVSINGENEIVVSGDIPSGRSGIVIHDYGKGLSAITYRVTSLKNNRALAKKYSGLEHDNIPNIKTKLNIGDRVIFGNMYNNVLLIAPNEIVYNNIIKSMPDRFWIHPDLYAYYFIENGEDKITIENLREFANKNLVGLIAIVAKDGLRVLDPISGKYLRKIPLNIDISNIKTAKIPFYARFEDIDDKFKSSSNYLSRYFNIIEGIR